MIAKSRKLSPFEKVFFSTHECIQFAVETEMKSTIPLVISNLKKSILGLNYKIEGDTLYYDEKEINVHKLPNEIRTCRDACSYMDQKMHIDFTDSLAYIAANDHIISVNISHMICDGGFFVDLHKRLLDENNNTSYYNPPSRYMTYSISELFPNELKKYGTPEVKKNLHDHEDFVPFLHHSKVLDPLTEENPKCISHIYETPAEEFQFMKNKMNLSDMYWTMIPLNFYAFKNSLQDNFGIYSCVDFRRFLPQSQISRLINLCFTEYGIGFNGVTPKMTIREVGKLFRQDFTRSLVDGRCFAALANDDIIPSPETKTAYAEISNIGRFTLKKPLVDLFIQQTMKSKCVEGLFCSSSFSRNCHGKEIICTRFQQAPTAFNYEDTRIISKSVVESMKHIDPDSTIQEAYDEIRKFQSKIRSHKL